MSLLLTAEILPDLPCPDFSGTFPDHMAQKKNPAVRAASLSAWSLLAYGLHMLGQSALPAVRFGARGKPYFSDSPLCFSLAHSGALAAVLISDVPCGVDIERIRPEVAARLSARCLSDAERTRRIDFFECWTKKECVGKRDGAGISAHPSCIDTLDAQFENAFFCARVHDAAGAEYALSALCPDAPGLRVHRIDPDALTTLAQST